MLNVEAEILLCSKNTSRGFVYNWSFRELVDQSDFDGFKSFPPDFHVKSMLGNAPRNNLEDT